MLKIAVKDFGPIVQGEVNLKPLTIFIGPSNAGKSYMAMLIYSLMQSSGFPLLPYPRYFFHATRSRFGRLPRARPVAGIEFDISQEVYEALGHWAREIEVHPGTSLNFQFTSLPKEVQAFASNFVESSLQATRQFFSRDLQRCHGKISDLERRAADRTQLQVSLEQSEPLLRLEFLGEPDAVELAMPRVNFDLSQVKLEGFPWVMIRELQTDTSARRRSRENFDGSFEFVGALVEATSATLFENFPRESYYLPAARSGIAQGHKAVASILVRQSSFTALQPLEIPTLSGIITDFISHILTMERVGRRRSASDLDDVVQFLEHRVVQGKIDIEEGQEVSYPEISYEPYRGQPGMSKFPFHKTSSMVSELAPVILFLKYLVDSGDLVILEEPESHLHPASQRQMARGIARLVNAGVRVIITTYSDYFIGQINNLLKLSQASRQKRNREGYAAEDCLKPEDVGAYHFMLDDEKGGSIVKELAITPDSGIDEDEFAAVSEALYEETVALQRIRT